MDGMRNLRSHWRPITGESGSCFQTCPLNALKGNLAERIMIEMMIGVGINPENSITVTYIGQDYSAA